MSKPARRPRETEIIGNALTLLRTEGDAGLSMRAVANSTGISLSNVQYYFRDKEALLDALVEDYIVQCEAFLRQTTGSFEGGDREQALVAFLVRILSDDHELSEMCATFREVWAIATRNPHVESLLRRYYQRTADLLCETLLKDVADSAVQAQMVNLIIPYIEGFTITGPLSGHDVEESARLLARVAFGLARTHEARRS